RSGPFVHDDAAARIDGDVAVEWGSGNRAAQASAREGVAAAGEHHIAARVEREVGARRRVGADAADAGAGQVAARVPPVHAQVADHGDGLVVGRDGGGVVGAARAAVDRDRAGADRLRTARAVRADVGGVGIAGHAAARAAGDADRAARADGL